MAEAVIEETARGPGFPGRRLTVYDLVPWLLDAAATEAQAAEYYGLAPTQVAAARAYLLANYDAVMARHREFEARADAGNPPDVLARIRAARPGWVLFREYVAASAGRAGPAGPGLTFEEWVADRDAAAVPAGA